MIPASFTMNEEEEQLLHRGEEKTQNSSRRRSISAVNLIVYTFFIHCMLATSLLGNLQQYLKCRPHSDEFVIFPELRNLGKVFSNEHATDHKAYSNFSGPPNQENAAEWKQLLQPLYFNASEAELRLAGASITESVRVKEGGFIASLGVYHELHCLNKLRYFLYTPEKTTNKEWVEHMGTSYGEVSRNRLLICCIQTIV